MSSFIKLIGKIQKQSHINIASEKRIPFSTKTSELGYILSLSLILLKISKLAGFPTVAILSDP